MGNNSFLTVPEAAIRLNLSVAWVRRLCQEERIQAHKIGRDWVIPESAIKQFSQIPRKVGRPPKHQ